MIDLPPPFRAVAYDVLGSTSDEAKRLAQEGAPHGTAIWALEQTGGRGRMDRAWSSPPGNLYISFILRSDVIVRRAAELGFVAAVAVAECVASFTAAEVRVKWPNDVLADGKKIAGMLLETQSTGDRLDWLVLGIGINVESHPEDVRYPATSLVVQQPQHPHRTLPRKRERANSELPLPLAGEGRGGGATTAVLRRLCEELATSLTTWESSGFPPIRDRWLARAHKPGDSLELRQGDTRITGRFRDLDSDGALVLDTPTGLRRITTGDVRLVAG